MAQTVAQNNTTQQMNTEVDFLGTEEQLEKSTFVTRNYSRKIQRVRPGIQQGRDDDIEALKQEIAGLRDENRELREKYHKKC